MTSILILFGLMIFLAGVLIIVKPEFIFGLLRNNLEKVALQVFTIGIRVIIGILLISSAAESKYPDIIKILGWLALAAAITLSVIGRQDFQRLMSWAFSLLKKYGRVGGLFAMLFGGFIIYAFV